jgi:hypothetical protein
MQVSRHPVRCKITAPVRAVKLEEHPGSSLRSPTGTLVEIPANSIVELEGAASPAGLINVIWDGDPFSVFYEELTEKSQVVSAEKLPH